jgi:hypothetical protein
MGDIEALVQGIPAPRPSAIRFAVKRRDIADIQPTSAMDHGNALCSYSEFDGDAAFVGSMQSQIVARGIPLRENRTAETFVEHSQIVLTIQAHAPRVGKMDEPLRRAIVTTAQTGPSTLAQPVPGVVI